MDNSFKISKQIWMTFSVVYYLHWDKKQSPNCQPTDYKTSKQTLQVSNSVKWPAFVLPVNKVIFPSFFEWFNLLNFRCLQSIIPPIWKVIFHIDLVVVTRQYLMGYILSQIEWTKLYLVNTSSWTILIVYGLMHHWSAIYQTIALEQGSKPYRYN